MEKSENLVELRNINLTYNRGKENSFQSLYDVDVNIKKGEFVVILGPSGCGKSSLLNIIAGLEGPDEGTVFINGEDVLKMKASEQTEFHRTKIGMVFQSYNLISTLSVLNNVALPQIFINAKKKEREEKAMELLKRFGIENQWKRIPSQLSGGQQQRIGIARAIVNNPPLILADEPVGNLDSESANNVMQIMSELNKNEGKTVLLVTHNPENVAWGTHIIHMKDGRIIKEEYKDAETGISQEVQSPEEEGKSKLDKIIEKFRGLSEKQIRFLMEPLKAKLIAESFLLPYDENQMKEIEASVKAKLSGIYDTAKFFEQLDKSSEKGGAGLDERVARKFAMDLDDLIDVSKKVFGNYSSKEKSFMLVS
jgi:putative ABC transport system ATP-binding protein